MTAQENVLAFLEAQLCAAGLGPVRRIDTHISSLLLAKDRVLKLKKAVDLGFLDYRDLENRHHYCQEEVRLNARTSPEIYQGVLIVYEQNGTLNHGFDLPDGAKALEYLVQMRRFADDALLSDQLHLPRELINKVVEAVWQAHKSAPLSPPGFGGVSGLESVIHSNHRAFLAGPLASRADEITNATLTALENVRSIAQQRVADGKIRLCHGDLHCGNICLLDGEPKLFDAIEFSPDFQNIDLFYDFAFLLMDLEARGHRKAASWAMGHYFDLSGDYQAMIMAPVMLSLRAAIRAHVAATTSLHVNAKDEIAKAEGYLGMALDYLTPPPARLLAFGGLSGSGKSRLAREISGLIGHPAAVVLRTDAIRKQILNKGLTERLGPDGYTDEVTNTTYGRLMDLAETLLQAGIPVIIDGVNAKQSQRQSFQDLANRLGVPFQGLWVDVPVDRAAERIENRVNNASDATIAVFQAQTKYDLGDITWPRISSAGTKDETLRLAIEALGL